MTFSRNGIAFRRNGMTFLCHIFRPITIQAKLTVNKSRIKPSKTQLRKSNKSTSYMFRLSRSHLQADI
jgi:hypothetical protein